MQSVGAAWLMTTLTSSSLLVALVQSASSLPFFFLALPSGAIADVVDRRRLLLIAQSWMLIVATVLAVLTLCGWMIPSVLLILTFALGLGSVLTAPAWQAITPEIVSREELMPAITLNSAGFNISRALGPALAGLIIAVWGVGITFLINAASFLGVIEVLRRWQRPPREGVAPVERVEGAIRAGIRYVRHSPDLQIILLRVALFAMAGSALWALLPLVVQHLFGHNALSYGLFLGCLGAGAVIGAIFLPQFRKKLARHYLVALGTLVFSLSTLALWTLTQPVLIGVALLFGGMAWIAVLSTFNAMVQMLSPDWVRGRVLAHYLLAFQGSIALGSALWGWVANHTSLHTSLGISGGILLLNAGLTVLKPLPPTGHLDLNPSVQWPEHSGFLQPHSERGPVLITINYRIKPENVAAFTQAIHAVSRIRRRDGAIRWGIYQNLADPEEFTETFVTESWAEHMRQHERMTVTDRHIQQEAWKYHEGKSRPRATHLIYAETVC
jgi:MFS family permease